LKQQNIKLKEEINKNVILQGQINFLKLDYQEKIDHLSKQLLEIKNVESIIETPTEESIINTISFEKENPFVFLYLFIIFLIF
jgi:hypothetical protein